MATEWTRSRRLTLAFINIVVLSFDSLLVRLVLTDGLNIAFWRGALMAIVIGLFYYQRRRLATSSHHRAPRWVRPYYWRRPPYIE